MKVQCDCFVTKIEQWNTRAALQPSRFILVSENMISKSIYLDKVYAMNGISACMRCELSNVRVHSRCKRATNAIILRTFSHSI